MKRLQQALGLRDEDIALIEAPIIAENSSSSTPPPPRKNNFIQYIGACIIGIVIGGTVIYALFHRDTSSSCAMENYISSDRISFGEKILLKQDTNSDKEAGVKAFLNGDCPTAINKFNSYRQANRTDPEALIYLNNAKARQQEERLKIAVSVPIGTVAGIAKEMLRGVAQAQNQVNNSGGINGKALEVVIGNDDNDPNTASNIANSFVKDSSILAVVGHNNSTTSLAAAPEYQRGRLVMISPTSYTQNISGLGNYIFRTAPGIKSIVNSISSYAIKKKKKNFLICFDETNTDNLSIKNNFVEVIKKAGGTINPTDCNIFASNFHPSEIIYQAKNSGANALLLDVYIDKARDTNKQGSALVRANQGQLALFSTPTLYTEETLQEGKAVNNMVISVPWLPTAFSNNPFVQKAQNLWVAPVSWRTATSYDATKAIIEGLQNSHTREELQNTLHSPRFSVDGATGKIQFAESGDRINNSIFLVQVQKKLGNSNKEEYEFVPITP